MFVIEHWETGMWEPDSDGSELSDRASGSCHTGLISPMTHWEAQPVTCRVVQQVMKAGRMVLGRQEPGAVGKRSKDKMSCSPCRRGTTIFDFAAVRQLWTGSLCSSGRCVSNAFQKLGSLYACLYNCFVCFIRKQLISPFLTYNTHSNKLWSLNFFCKAAICCTYYRVQFILLSVTLSVLTR